MRARTGLALLIAALLTLVGLPTASATTPGAPSFNAVVVQGSTSLELQYGSVSGATSYDYSMNGGAPVSMGTTQPFTVTGLTAGTLYCFTLTATTAGGTSDPSETKCGIPGLVQNPTTKLVITGITSPSPGTLAIAYTRPSDPAGMDAIEIRVNGQFFAWAYDLRSPLIVPGFTPGATVSVQIKGGMMGYSPDTNFSDPFTATVGAGTPPAPRITAPGVPRITVLESTATTIRYWVDVPFNDGGQGPYVYEAGIQGGVLTAFNPNERERVATGLQPNRSYVLQARARNDAGWGPDVVVNATTTSGPPTAPQSVVAMGGVRSATVSWAPPASEQGSAVTGYTVKVGEVTVQASATDRSAKVTGLPSWSTLPVSVTASNAIGTSPSASTTVKTAESQPTAVRNLKVETLAKRRIEVTWDPPEDLGDPRVPVRFLVMQGLSPICAGPDGKIQPIVTGTGCESLQSFYPGTLTISVSTMGPKGFIMNEEGTRAVGAAVTHAIADREPTAPRNVQASVVDDGIQVTWNASSNARTAGVDEYVVNARLVGTRGTVDIDRACTTEELTCTIPAAVRGEYRITVTAVNRAGESDPSARVDVDLQDSPVNASIDVSSLGRGISSIMVRCPVKALKGQGAECWYSVTGPDGFKREGVNDRYVFSQEVLRWDDPVGEYTVRTRVRNDAGISRTVERTFTHPVPAS